MASLPGDSISFTSIVKDCLVRVSIAGERRKVAVTVKGGHCSSGKSFRTDREEVGSSFKIFCVDRRVLAAISEILTRDTGSTSAE